MTLFKDHFILESVLQLKVSLSLEVLPRQISNLGDISFRSKFDERKVLSQDFFSFDL